MFKRGCAERTAIRADANETRTRRAATNYKLLRDRRQVVYTFRHY